MKQKKIYIYGKHAVRELLAYAPHLVRTIYLSSNMKDGELLKFVKHSGAPVEELDDRKATSQVEGNAPHQGIIALISLSSLTTSFEEFNANYAPAPGTLLVYLDDVGDPQNVGAIIRTCAAFGASAILFSARTPLTGVVIKASAGAAFRIPLIVVSNPQQALASLRKVGVKIYGLAGKGSSNITAESFDGTSLFVFGNEATGISPSARTLCNTMIHIPISSRVESLNVAGAAAAALFAWSHKHPKALTP